LPPANNAAFCPDTDDWMAWFNGKGIYAHGCEKPSEWRAANKASR